MGLENQKLHIQTARRDKAKTPCRDTYAAVKNLRRYSNFVPNFDPFNLRVWKKCISQKLLEIQRSFQQYKERQNRSSTALDMSLATKVLQILLHLRLFPTWDHRELRFSHRIAPKLDPNHLGIIP